MRSTTILTTLVAMLLVGSATSRAATPAEIEAARVKLVSNWDATPSLDLDFLEATAKDQLPFLRANALGTRVSYRFRSDGRFTSIVLRRNGPEDGLNVDRLVSKRGAGQWSVLDVSGKDVKVRFTPEDGPPVDRLLKFTNDDALDLETPELQDKMFATPTPFRRNLGERIVKWLQVNSTAGPNGPLVRDMVQFMGAALKAREDFVLRFGKGLMKSGKATEVSGFCEQFFVLELSDEQAKQLKLTDSEVTTHHSPRAETFPVLTSAKVTEVKMDTSAPIDLSKPIIATVTVDSDRVVQISPDGGDCSIRCRIEAGGNATALFANFIAPVLGGAKANMKVKPPALYATYEGPVVVYFDLCREISFEGGVSAIEVLSNSHQVLLNAKPAAKSP